MAKVRLREKLAESRLYTLALGSSIGAFLIMIISFASPYWFRSWNRVHSIFSNIGLWHICLAGYIKPRDSTMKSYVGCWWIHSAEFSDVTDQIMPPWFRGVQALATFTVICNLLAMVFLLLYKYRGSKKRLYVGKEARMFFINGMLLTAAGAFVFIDSLVFAEYSNDKKWMPRPYLNNYSWGYGLNVLSGFFSAFGAMFCVMKGLKLIDNPPSSREIEYPVQDEKPGETTI